MNGQTLPSMGFFGPKDVCVGDWLHELASAAQVLRTSDPATYVFDEGEQGQPAFLFECERGFVTVSVVRSEIGGGEGSPEWGRQTCTLLEFETEVRRFITELEVGFERAVPGHGQAWVRERHKPSWLTGMGPHAASP